MHIVICLKNGNAMEKGSIHHVQYSKSGSGNRMSLSRPAQQKLAALQQDFFSTLHKIRTLT